MCKKRNEILTSKKIKVVPSKQINDKFTIVSNAAIALLDSKSFHIYCYLLSCCDENSYCYPSYDDIQDKLNMNRNTISTSIKFLKEVAEVTCYEMILDWLISRKRNEVPI